MGYLWMLDVYAKPDAVLFLEQHNIYLHVLEPIQKLELALIIAKNTNLLDRSHPICNALHNLETQYIKVWILADGAETLRNSVRAMEAKQLDACTIAFVKVQTYEKILKFADELVPIIHRITGLSLQYLADKNVSTKESTETCLGESWDFEPYHNKLLGCAHILVKLFEWREGQRCALEEARKDFEDRASTSKTPATNTGTENQT